MSVAFVPLALIADLIHEHRAGQCDESVGTLAAHHGEPAGKIVGAIGGHELKLHSQGPIKRFPAERRIFLFRGRRDNFRVSHGLQMSVCRQSEHEAKCRGHHELGSPIAT